MDNTKVPSKNNFPDSLRILIPVYNDWESAGILLGNLAKVLKNKTIADVLFINDGSSNLPPTSWPAQQEGIRSTRVLSLKRNLGHQRAICIGMCFLLDEGECSPVVIMDSDGEDQPNDILKLATKLGEADDIDIVFAERAKRSEGFIFVFLYQIYRLLHLLLVGTRIKVGNFSVMNKDCLQSLCSTSDLWNHFAASAFATRQRISFVKTNRGKRYAGKSKMNLTGLIMHGLSALSVFSAKIGTRILIFSAFGFALSLVLAACMIWIQLTSSDFLPAWTAFVIATLCVIALQILTIASFFCFLVLFTRGLSTFIPSRDYKNFILHIKN